VDKEKAFFSWIGENLNPQKVEQAKDNLDHVQNN